MQQSNTKHARISLLQSFLLNLLISLKDLEFKITKRFRMKFYAQIFFVNVL